MQNLTLAEDSFDRAEVAECGCRLSRNSVGSVSHHFCPMHAAAPELLEALEAIVPQCQDCKGTGRRLVYADPSENPPCTQALCIEARAAIKAAKGD